MAIGDEKEGDNLQALAVVPVLVTLFARSGDANQGGEMQILMRELDEFEMPLAAREGLPQAPAERCDLDRVVT